MRLTHVSIEDYEKRDLEWWCLHHKQNLSHVCVRLRQYMDMESDEERAEFEPILDVLLNNFAQKGIGLVREFEEE